MINSPGPSRGRGVSRKHIAQHKLYSNDMRYSQSLTAKNVVGEDVLPLPPTVARLSLLTTRATTYQVRFLRSSNFQVL